MTPLVSINIAVWNQEKLILRALDSIPERDDIEIIVVNDGSTDNTLQNVKEWHEKHPNVNLKLITYSENMGVGHAKNVGLEQATGIYYVELDSDDYFYTSEFLKCLKLLDGTDMVYFNLVVNSGQTWRLNANSSKVFVGSTKFIRRDFIGDVRYPEIREVEDWFFNENLQKKHPSHKYTDIDVKHYDWPREGSITWMRGHKK